MNEHNGGAGLSGRGQAHATLQKHFCLAQLCLPTFQTCCSGFNANLRRKAAFKKLLMRIIRAWIMSYRVFLWLRDAAKHVRTSASAVSVCQPSAHVLNPEPFRSNLGRNQMQILECWRLQRPLRPQSVTLSSASCSSPAARPLVTRR